MNSLGSNDDCYFYFYSSCTKGDECPFRHCEAALGTETVCSLWREGRCIRDNCKFRHMESRINRGYIPCYWEDQPSGCLKPHCVFFHRKPKTVAKPNAGSEGLILPVSTNTPQISPSTKVIEVKDTFKNIPVESYSSNIDDSDDCPASIPIEPIVFSFDNEESDSESASSTPMKSTPNDLKNNSASAKKNLLDVLSGNDDFGIKTLEQIKMEKIHKESDNFYKSAYDAPLIDPVQIKMKTDSFKTEVYPPKAEFIPVATRPVVETPISATSDSKDQSPENERSIRNRLLKRRNTSAYAEKSIPPKKVINLKKTKDDTLDFKIKTLDEIRKEKMNKQGKEETPVESTSLKNNIKESRIIESPALSKRESPSVNGKSFRKLRLKRQFDDTLPNSTSILQEADSSSDAQKKERNQMILHEVQNISEDQSKADSKISLGKRKDSPTNCTDEKSPKQLKMNNSTSPKNNCLVVEESEERPVKCFRPVIKRKISTSLLQPSISPPKEISSTVGNVIESKVSEQSEKATAEANTPSKIDDSDKLALDKEKPTHKTSVDDIDNFLLNEANVSLDYEPDGSINESDDLLLEIEQLLES